MLSYIQGRLAKGAMDTLYMHEQRALEDLRSSVDEFATIHSVRIQFTLDELYNQMLGMSDNPDDIPGPKEKLVIYYFHERPNLSNPDEQYDSDRKSELAFTLAWLVERDLLRSYARSYWLTRLGKTMAELVEAIQ